MLLSAKAPPSWRDRLNAERPTPNIDRRTGEGGIRTLGSLLGYGALAKRCFQPLSHLTKIVATGRATSLRYELRLGKQARDSRRESRISRRIRLFQSAILVRWLSG